MRRFGDELLPTIFTIGFGLNYDIDSTTGLHTICGRLPITTVFAVMTLGGAGDNVTLQRLRNADYLGEELLRYIADVGDNFQIDSDYWQQGYGRDARQRRRPLLLHRIGDSAWSLRGTATPVPSTAMATSYDPKPPRQSCGNFFDAASGAELEKVFNEIASRMFTRLSQ